MIPQLGEYIYPYPFFENHNSKLNPNGGVLIAVEGGDGAGKSTFVKHLVDEIGKDDIVNCGNFIHSPWFKDILLQFKYYNCDEYSFSLLYTTALARFFTEEVADKLEAGNIVIVDRYILSILSKGVIRGVSREWLNNILSVFRKPDMTILIDTDVDVCLERKMKESDILSYWECGCMLSSDDSLRFNYDEVKYRKGFFEYQSKIKEIMLDEMNTKENVFLINPSITSDESVHMLIKEKYMDASG